MSSKTPPTKRWLISILYNDEDDSSASISDPRFQPPITRRRVLRLRVKERGNKQAEILLSKRNALKLYRCIGEWLTT